MSLGFFTRLINKALCRRVKICFVVKIENSHDEIRENLWATPMGNELFEVDNSPFYAFGVSFKDIVKATKVEDKNMFVSVLKHSGHSTIRIRMGAEKTHEHFLESWHEFEELGCTYEGFSSAKHRYYTIDILPNVDIDFVISLFAIKEKEGIWEYEEAYIHRTG